MTGRVFFLPIPAPVEIGKTSQIGRYTGVSHSSFFWPYSSQINSSITCIFGLYDICAPTLARVTLTRTTHTRKIIFLCSLRVKFINFAKFVKINLSNDLNHIFIHVEGFSNIETEDLSFIYTNEFD